MPLSMMGVGTRHQIKRVAGNDAVRKRLESMGFTEGAYVEIVSESNGNLILGVMDSRVAVDKGLASRILV